MPKFRIGYHFKEAMKSLFRNKLVTVVSMLSVMFTLMIVGVFTSILLNVNKVTTEVEDNVEIVTYIDKGTSEEALSGIEEEISGYKLVDSVAFVSKEEGLENLMEDLGEDGEAFQSLKEDNPLNDTFIVKTLNPQDTEQVAKKIEEITFVEKVDYGEDVIEILFTITDWTRQIGLYLIAGLVVTALLLISNTIRMTIEMRKEEIKVMKLVGATNGFIRAPFILEGILLGVAGSIIPIGLMYVGYAYLYEMYQSSVAITFAQLLPVNEVMGPVVALVIGIAIVIGAIGSLISIGRYLKV